MNSKNIKVVDEHNFDRSASILFAFELDGSGYVTYSIERDNENVNIFMSKVLKNFDSTFSMLDVDDAAEKSRLNDVVKMIITKSVESQEDKFVGDTLTLSDGKVVKFMSVNFNKEQRINVTKTYITTVKKEVGRVVEKYYDIQFVVEQPKVQESIFQTVTPLVEPVKENVVAQAAPAVETPVLPPLPVENTVSEPVNVVSPEPVVVAPSVVPPVEVIPTTSVPPVVETPVLPAEPVAPVVEPVTVVPPVEAPVVAPQPSVSSTPSVVEPQPLVFNASKETNLNAALGEVASSTSIPVGNIEPVREFGVDAPLQQPVVNAQPIMQANVVPGTTEGVPVDATKKGGFANSKFFMVVAIAF